MNTQAAMEHLEPNTTVDVIWGEQKAVANALENTIYYRRKLLRTRGAVKSMEIQKLC